MSTTRAARKPENERLIDEILRFWIGDLVAYDDVDLAKLETWWRADAALDEEIRSRFGEPLRRALAGELDELAQSPRGALALVVLLDQFTRNVGRGTRMAFAGDRKALEVCRQAVERGHDRQLRPVERAFLYMPMMHAEDREVARRSVTAFAGLAQEIAALEKPGYPDFAAHAVAHAEIIERFGRYPHRNEIVGRPSTPEEEIFLQSDAPSFGQRKRS